MTGGAGMLVNDGWWAQAESFVDADDIVRMGSGAVELLRDLVVSRPVEFGRMKKLFLRALKNPVLLLPRQKRALYLAEEAICWNYNVYEYVGDQLGIKPDSAYRLLRRANEKALLLEILPKMSEFEANVHYIDNGIQNKFELPRDEVNKIRDGLSVACPTRPYNPRCNGIAPARYGICFECRDTFLKGDDLPEWVVALVRDTRLEAYQEAKERLFYKKYGANIDIRDVL